MTRDEAIKIISDGGYQKSNSEAEIGDWLDLHVALGMLKLDEPKRKDRLADAIMSKGLAEPDPVARINALSEIMDRCGLKIVSK